jgi:cell division protein FtsZ
MSDADVKLDVGRDLTRGLGAGADPRSAGVPRRTTPRRSRRRSRAPTWSSSPRARAAGTGTGGAPVVARIAKSIGALTIGVVTKPFGFEGKRRQTQAEQGVARLKEEVDTLIVVPNDRLLEISDRGISMLEAFATADQVLLAGVQGITDLITTPGLINLDFADVKSVMQGAGSALMGIGSSRGADRRSRPPSSRSRVPLLEASIDGAHGVLLSIQGGSNLGIFEINDAARLVQEAVHPEANIIFGAVIDDTLGDEVRVTVIAAGFDGGEPDAKPQPVEARRTSFVRPRRRRRRGRRVPRRLGRRLHREVIGEIDIDELVETANWGEAPLGGRRSDRVGPRVRRRRRRPRHPRLPEVMPEPVGRAGAHVSALAERLASVQGSIADAARDAGRHPREITTIVVTKFQPVALIAELAELGVQDVGENRHQEAQQKAAELGVARTALALRRAAAEQEGEAGPRVRERHPLGRPARARRGAALRRRHGRLLRAGEPHRRPGAGASHPTASTRSSSRCSARRAPAAGLMAVAPLGEPPRPAFARVRLLSERVQRIDPDAASLSIGMSHDFPRSHPGGRDTPEDRHSNHRQSAEAG